jgi:acyl carrier protein
MGAGPAYIKRGMSGMDQGAVRTASGNMDNIAERIRSVMADVLGLDQSAISMSSTMHNTSEWDSLHHINLIAALEQEFETTFEISEIQAMTSVPEIVRCLSLRRAGSHGPS